MLTPARRLRSWLTHVEEESGSSSWRRDPNLRVTHYHCHQNDDDHAENIIEKWNGTYSNG